MKQCHKSEEQLEMIYLDGVDILTICLLNLATLMPMFSFSLDSSSYSQIH